MGESSGEQPKVKGDTAKRTLRRWEDKAVLGLGSALLGLVAWMWNGLSAQIADLEKAKAATETRIAVQHTEINSLKEALIRIESKLDKALEARK